MTTDQPSIIEFMKGVLEEARTRCDGRWSYPEPVHVIPRWMFEEAEKHGFKIVSTGWGVAVTDEEPATDA